MPAGIATIYSTARLTGAGATSLGRPVRPGGLPSGSAELGGGRPVVLNIERDRDGTTGALDGTVAVWGAPLADPMSGSAAVVQRSIATGASNLFDTDGVNLTYVAPANNNWLVRIGGPGGTFIDFNAAPASNTQFGVTNPSGNVARITVGGASLVINTIVEIWKVTPVQIKVAAAYGLGIREEITAYDVMWTNLVHNATNLSATLVTVETEGH